MPQQKIFSIDIAIQDTIFKIPVHQVSFSNGCTIYKLMKNGSFWLINSNDKWKITAVDMPDNEIKLAIIKILDDLTVKSTQLKIVK
jgi:hypothetical protein